MLTTKQEWKNLSQKYPTTCISLPNNPNLVRIVGLLAKSNGITPTRYIKYMIRRYHEQIILKKYPIPN